MDPTPAVNAISEPVTIAALVALAMGLMEVIKQLVGWLGKKLSGKDAAHQTLLVQLDPEVSRIIHESGEQVKAMSAVVFKTDNDGVPLVYSDRKAEENISRLASSMTVLTDAQNRLAISMGRLDNLFEQHDKTDAIVFSRMTDSMMRLEAIGNSNRESLIIFKKDHEIALSALDKMQRDHSDHDRRVTTAISMQQDILGKLQQK